MFFNTNKEMLRKCTPLFFLCNLCTNHKEVRTHTVAYKMSVCTMLERSWLTDNQVEFKVCFLRCCRKTWEKRSRRTSPHVSSREQATNLFDSIQQPLQEVLSLGITLLCACRHKRDLFGWCVRRISWNTVTDCNCMHVREERKEGSESSQSQHESTILFCLCGHLYLQQH